MLSLSSALEYWADMEAWQIILLIVVFVSFFYISLVVYVLTQMREFRIRLNRRRRGLSLLLYERSNILSQAIDLFAGEGMEFTPEDQACFDALKKLAFTKTDEKTLREEADLVKMTTSRIKYLAQANRWASKQKEFEEYVGLLEDLERNYRMTIGKYNMDVNAYNYWIAIPTVGWLGWLVGFRKKSLLS